MELPLWFRNMADFYLSHDEYDGMRLLEKHIAVPPEFQVLEPTARISGRLKQDMQRVRQLLNEDELKPIVEPFHRYMLATMIDQHLGDYRTAFAEASQDTSIFDGDSESIEAQTSRARESQNVEELEIAHQRLGRRVMKLLQPLFISKVERLRSLLQELDYSPLELIGGEPVLQAAHAELDHLRAEEPWILRFGRADRALKEEQALYPEKVQGIMEQFISQFDGEAIQFYRPEKITGNFTASFRSPERDRLYTAIFLVPASNPRARIAHYAGGFHEAGHALQASLYRSRPGTLYPSHTPIVDRFGTEVVAAVTQTIPGELPFLQTFTKDSQHHHVIHEAMQSYQEYAAIGSGPMQLIVEMTCLQSDKTGEDLGDLLQATYLKHLKQINQTQGSFKNIQLMAARAGVSPYVPGEHSAGYAIAQAGARDVLKELKRDKLWADPTRSPALKNYFSSVLKGEAYVSHIPA